jgi:hypothetical protein
MVIFVVQGRNLAFTDSSGMYLAIPPYIFITVSRNY